MMTIISLHGQYFVLSEFGRFVQALVFAQFHLDHLYDKVSANDVTSTSSSVSENKQDTPASQLQTHKISTTGVSSFLKNIHTKTRNSKLALFKKKTRFSEIIETPGTLCFLYVIYYIRILHNMWNMPHIMLITCSASRFELSSHCRCRSPCSSG